jgi:diacylglycerol O-acyltransferase
LRLGSRLTPGNLVISNVPGPRTPLYAAGARLEHYYPVSTIVDGQGLNITVQSYLDRLDWGLVSCAELVPDVDVLLGDILDEMDTLAAAAETATSAAPEPESTSPVGRNPSPSQSGPAGARR